MTFVFGWRELATPEVIASLYGYCGVAAPDPPPRDAVDTLAAVLESVGGVPLTDEAWDAQAARGHALGLVDEACVHVLSTMAAPEAGSGVWKEPEGALPFALRARAVATVAVNAATAAQLEALPIVGAVLAGRIVAERRRGGAFADMADLDDRVRGIGEGATPLAGILDFTPPHRLIGRAANTPKKRFALVASVAGRDEDPVVAALELLAATCASDPHPATAAQDRRVTAPQLPDLDLDASWIGIVADDAYHPAVAGLIADARVSIDVCLFHAALGGPAHPTASLLAALGAATARGVAVRVLLDRDRDDDPYRSTVTNADAVAYLRGQGVPVRQDPEDELLHSKFVVVDGALVVIGSHNWSLGSFEQMDEVSVCVESPPLAAALRARFDAVWG